MRRALANCDDVIVSLASLENLQSKNVREL